MGLGVGVLLMLASAGLIAYVGDALGRRIGRKRLTLFGLRPRKTAILFTVVTGMLIAGLTLGLTLLVSQDLRNRLLHYGEIVTDLQAKATHAEQQRRAASRNLDQARGALALERRRTQDEQRQTAQALAARREAQARLRQALAEAERAELRVTALGHDLAGARARVGQAQGKVAALTSQSERQRAEIQANQTRIAAQESEVRAAAKELANATRILNDTNQQLDQARAQLRLAQERVQEVLARELERLQSKVVYHQNEEIARVAIPRNWTAEHIQTAVTAFALDLDRRAKAQGAAEYRPVGLCAVPVSQPEGTDVNRYLARLSAAVAAQNRTVWLRAVVVFNTLRGDTVFYTFVVWPERVVFTANELLGSVELDGRRPEGELVQALRTLITEKVRPLAETRGMLPRLDGSPKEIPPEVWLPALRRIAAAAGPVTVAVVATRDIGVDDPFAIEFRVTPRDAP